MEPPNSKNQVMVLNLGGKNLRKNKSKKERYLEVKSLVESKRGTLVTKIPLLAEECFEVLCEKKHDPFKIKAGNLRLGKWCPYCAKNKLPSEKTIKKELGIRGYDFISTIRTKKQREIKLKCRKHNHIWVASWGTLQKHGCKLCGLEKSAQSRRKYSLDQIRKLAFKNNCRLLSKDYKITSDRIELECKKCGWAWKTGASNLLAEKGCPSCAGVLLLTIEDARVLGKERGLDLLSKEYVNSKTLLSWKCLEGHTFDRTYTDLKGTLKSKPKHCPYCKKSIGEELTRAVFEQIFNVSFATTRSLDWLKNSRGNHMELDGYNSKLKLAFEYHGIQHYKKGFYSNSNARLKQRISDDKKKRTLVEENGITLIEVTYEVPLLDIYTHIISLLKKNDVRIPKHSPVKEIQPAFKNSKFNELKAKVVKRDGKLLERCYLGSEVGHRVKCKCGHLWAPTPYMILKMNTWCPACAGNLGIDIKKSDLKKKILGLKKKMRRVPSQGDWNNSNLKPSVSWIKKKYGGWNNLLRSIGLRLYEFGKGKVKYTKKQLLDLLVSYCVSGSPFPRAADLDAIKTLPGKNTYINAFGSWSKVKSLVIKKLRE